AFITALVVRAHGRPEDLVAPVRAAMQQTAANLPYAAVTPLADLVAPSIRPWRLGSTMFGVFAGLALVLAAVGLYGVLSYTVAQRSHEIGIRMAMGARRGNVLGLMVGQGVKIAALGAGIGANVAMFSIVDRMLFRPPTYLRDPGATHRVYLARFYRGEEFTDGGVQYARYVDLTNWTTSFARTAAFTEQDLAIGRDADVREMRVAIVSAGFFGFFDAPPVLGRYFTAAEDAPPTGTAVAVLGYGFWQTRYGGRRDAIGSTLQIGPTLYTIIGVAPRGFVGLWPNQPPAAFIPIASHANAESVNLRGDRWWTTYHWTWSSMLVPRQPGVSLAGATADLTEAYRRSYAAQWAES